MYVNTRVALSGAFKEKLPFTSVDAPVSEPLTRTLTPIKASPDASITLPRTSALCCSMLNFETRPVVSALLILATSRFELTLVSFNFTFFEYPFALTCIMATKMKMAVSFIICNI